MESDEELDEEERQIKEFMQSPQGNIMRQILWCAQDLALRVTVCTQDNDGRPDVHRT